MSYISRYRTDTRRRRQRRQRSWLVVGLLACVLAGWSAPLQSEPVAASAPQLTQVQTRA